MKLVSEQEIWGDWILSLKCCDKWMTCATHTAGQGGNRINNVCLMVTTTLTDTPFHIPDSRLKDTQKKNWFIIQHSANYCSSLLNKKIWLLGGEKYISLEYLQSYKIKGFGQHHLLSRERELSEQKNKCCFKPVWAKPKLTTNSLTYFIPSGTDFIFFIFADEAKEESRIKCKEGG